MKETVTLRRRNGTSGPAEAEVRRTSEGMRSVQAFGIFFGCVIVGVCTIVIPVAHLILPWAIPLIGAIIAVYVYGKKGDVDSVRGVCPACETEVDLLGGPIEASMWRACPSCKEPLQYVFKDE